MIDPKGARWKKSSRSGGASNSCVELACGADERLFRDSKNPAAGVLTFRASAAARFLAQVGRTS